MRNGILGCTAEGINSFPRETVSDQDREQNLEDIIEILHPEPPETCFELRAPN